MTRPEAVALINSLFESWYPVLLRHACRLTGNLDMAEDVVQDAFFLLYRELARGREVLHPKAWTLCVVRREIGRLVRDYRKEKRPESLERLGEFSTGWVDPDLTALFYDDIVRFFNRLSPRELEILLLRMEALKYREIAAQLGISANSVTTLLNRALRKIQAAVAAPPEAVGIVEAGAHVPKALQ